MNDPTDLNERRNLLTGPSWDALVALVVAEADYDAALKVEARRAA